MRGHILLVNRVQLHHEKCLEISRTLRSYPEVRGRDGDLLLQLLNNIRKVSSALRNPTSNTDVALPYGR